MFKAFILALALCIVAVQAVESPFTLRAKRQRTLHHGVPLPSVDVLPISSSFVSSPPPETLQSDSYESDQTGISSDAPLLVTPVHHQTHSSRAVTFTAKAFRGMKRYLTSFVGGVLRRPGLNFGRSLDRFKTARIAIYQLDEYLSATLENKEIASDHPVDIHLNLAYNRTLRALMNSYEIEVVKLTQLDPVKIEEASTMITMTYLLWNEMTEIVEGVKLLNVGVGIDVLQNISLKKLKRIELLIEEFTRCGDKAMGASKKFIDDAAHGRLKTDTLDKMNVLYFAWKELANSAFFYIRGVFNLDE